MRRLALLLVVVAAGCGGGDSGEPLSLADLEGRMLRLSDLPEGFHYGDDRSCSEIGTTEGDEPVLDEFLIRTRPRGCIVEFSREWGGEPWMVHSLFFHFGSEDDARRAWELREPLFGSFAPIYLTTEHGDDDAVRFDSRGQLKRGAGEAWRDGRLVVAVHEEGLPGERGRAFAAEIAERQRARIESPSSPESDDDREVALEDPAIAIPVYWLGREFAPEGLPRLTLEASSHLRGEGPGNDVKLDYAGGVTLDLWRPEAWERFTATRLGRLARCQARGRVRICRARIGHWLAQVHYPEVVVAVNMPYCFACRRPADDPYNSREAIEAVVGGLRRR